MTLSTTSLHRTRFGALVLTCLLACPLGACDDGGDSDLGPDAATPDAAAALPDAEPTPDAAGDMAPAAPSCAEGGFDRLGFTAVEDDLTPAQGVVTYSASSAPGTPYDSVVIQLYEGYENTPEAPGRFPLDGINFRDCGVCVLAFAGCESDGGCARQFYAQQGTVDITRLPDSGTFAARLEDVVFDEVDIDWGSYVSTPIEGGETWCVDGVEFEKSVETLSSRCDPNLVEGCARIGEVVPEITLQSCVDESPVTLSSVGADKKAIVLFLTAGWCPACSARMPDYVELAEQRADEGLEVVYVVGSDGNYEPATAAYCRNYSGQYDGARLDRFFFDHDGAKDFPSIFARMWRYPSPNNTFQIPWVGIIDARTMTYVYSEAAGDASFEETLDAVLARP